MIYFFQPSVPKYRVPFFNELATLIGRKSFKVVTSYEDYAGVKTCTEGNDFQIEFLGEFFNLFGSIFYQKGLITSIRRLKKRDIVVVNGNPRILSQMIVFLFCKFLGIKTIWWGQGWTASSRGLFSKIRHKIMRKADAVLLYTDGELNEYSPSNYFAINNGLSLYEPKLYTPKYKSRDDDKLRLVFIGRVSDKSNLEFALELIDEPDFEFVEFHIVGGGDLYPRLSNVYNSPRFIWHGPVYDEKCIAKIFEQCHFFIYPGAVGLSLIHAYSYFLPSITHSDSEHHMPEFSAFIEGVSGYSYINGNKESLRTLLMNLNLSDVKPLALNARMIVEKKYNTIMMAKNTLEILEYLGWSYDSSKCNSG